MEKADVVVTLLGESEAHLHRGCDVKVHDDELFGKRVENFGLPVRFDQDHVGLFSDFDFDSVFTKLDFDLLFDL